jgi:DedD protein
MPLLSFFKRKDSPAQADAADEAESVQAARVRARRRLVGAAVLVGLGIIGFPLLFETQPRPIAVDIPIEIPAKDGAAPLALPTQKSSAPAPRAAAPVITERAADAPASPASRVPVAPPVAASVAQKPERVADAPVAASRAVPKPDAKSEAQRAQALLDGRPVAANAAPTAAAAASEPRTERFVVQAGAYTDAAALREARQKVEKLGLKSYTQVVETDAGPRTRVRVGPFATREEAEKAAARIKGSGLAANILSL